MARIDFELRVAQREETGLLGQVATYACTALISSGPWIITTIALSVLALLGPLLGDDTNYTTLRALITYAFAFSLIGVGAVQMAVTRKVAEMLYAGERGRVLPALTTMLAAVALVQSGIAVGFCRLADLPAATSVVAVALYATVSMTWVALIWLSVLRDWNRVRLAYLWGAASSALAVLGLAATVGASGVLAAYTLGQGLTLVLLVRAIVRAVESAPRRELAVLRAPFQYPVLALAGLFYSGALWIDKIVFWLIDGVGPSPWVRTHPLYESSSFLAYLTVVPALAVSLIHLETSFHERYRGYFRAILDGASASALGTRRRAVFESLRAGAYRLLRVQGAVTALCIALAPEIVAWLALPEATVHVFRLCCLGALFHVLLSITILVQTYFDLRRQALSSSLVFLVANGLGAWWSVRQGVPAFGAGYALAALVSLLFAFVALRRGVRDLEYRMFTRGVLTREHIAARA